MHDNYYMIHFNLQIELDPHSPLSFPFTDLFLEPNYALEIFHKDSFTISTFHRLGNDLTAS